MGVARTYNAEMAPVEGGDSGELKALCDDDQAGIRAAETEVGIGFDQVGDRPASADVIVSTWSSPAARARKNAASAVAPSCRPMR